MYKWDSKVAGGKGMPIIEVKDLSFIYGKGTTLEHKAINNVSVSIERGEFIGIIGHTGSGKSTFIKHLNGLMVPTEGKIFIDGVNIFSNPKKLKDVRSKVGMVFQYPEHQLFEETVFKDIAFGPKNMGLPEAVIEERVLAAIKFVELDTDILSKSPFDLSGGEKRRAAIAGVIAMDPEVLVLDEPTAGLDPLGSEEILNHIKEYHKKEKKTVILVSHNMEDIAKNAQKVMVLDNGNLKIFEETRVVFSKEEELEKIGLRIPQITKIMKKLQSMGVNIKDGILTVEEAAEEIIKLFEGRNIYSG